MDVGVRRVALLAAVAGTACGTAGMVLLALDGQAGRPDGLHLLMVGAATTISGFVLVWSRPRLRYGPIVLANGVAFGITLLVLGILVRNGPSGGGLAAQIAFAATYLLVPPLNIVWELQLICFPTGRFPSRRWERWVATTFTIDVIASVAAYLTAPAGHVRPFDLPVTTAVSGPWASTVHAVPSQVESLLGLALPVVALAGLVLRMRRAGPVERQQAKWLVSAMVAAVVAINAFPATLHPWHGVRGAGEILVMLSPLWIQAAIAVAIFRYHLWGIDVVLSKALTFAALSGVVSVAFAAMALAASALVGGFDQRSAVTVAMLSAFVLVAQRPRRRVDRAVRRVVYGERPHGYAVLNGLGRDLTNAGARGQLGTAVADAARRALSVPWAEVWLLGDNATVLHSSGSSGSAARQPTIALGAFLDQLAAVSVLPKANDQSGMLAALGDPALVVPLRSEYAVLGLLACGERRGEPLADGDLQLLEAIAREATLALQNRQLEGEVNDRVRELEAQAAELRRSRERLAHVQDDERRRIGRDLHDGVQQQLVTLAADLRRLASRPPAESGEALGEAAARAEDAVFSLQDLARGIYPSVLTDRGLGPALGAQAERLAADVHLDVEPAIVGRRFVPSVEAALYFVALEALANSQKHAPGARVTLTLRSDGSDVCLDVRDDGPGFNPARAVAHQGNGLLNMTDRTAAVGGNLTIESRPGAGTWVSARAPALSPVADIATRRTSRAQGGLP